MPYSPKYDFAPSLLLSQIGPSVQKIIPLHLNEGGHIQAIVQCEHVIISPGAVTKQKQTVEEDLVLQRP